MKGLIEAWDFYKVQAQLEEKKALGWEYINKKSKVSQLVITPTGEKISYYRFAQIYKLYCYNVSKHLIMGEQFNFKNGFGHLKARRVERDFSNKRLNLGATQMNKKVGIDKKVYCFDDDWCRIKWCHRSANDPQYAYLKFWFFEISRTSRNDGLKNRFSKALVENDWLKSRYDHYIL